MIDKKENIVRMVLSASDYVVLDHAVDHVIRIAKQERVKFSGPIPLPTRRTVWTVNRSPHIDKESREQFERKIYKRLFYVHATPGFVDAIGRHNLASGVDAKISLGGGR